MASTSLPTMRSQFLPQKLIILLHSTESLTLNVSACAGITSLFSRSYQLCDKRIDARNSEIQLEAPWPRTPIIPQSWEQIDTYAYLVRHRWR